MKTSFVWLLLLPFWGAAALPGMPLPCAAGIHRTSVSEWENLVQTVSIVGKIDNRKTFPDYAADHWPPVDMKLQFSGNGEFHCGDSVGGASFVYRNDLLVLDAHTFFHWNKDRTKCLGPVSKSDLELCYVKTISSNGEIQDRKFSINPSTLRMDKNYCANEGLTGNDWAVVELKHDPKIGLPTVIPYELYDTSKIRKADGTFKKIGVTVVSAGATNFKKGPVPTICDGEMGYVGYEKDSVGKVHIWQTNSCSSGPGDSGAGIAFYAPGEKPKLIGVQTFGKGPVNDGLPYGDDNFSAGTLIEGDLREALISCKLHCPTE